MRRIREAIVVEGKYDVIRVKSAVEAIVVPTEGFHIFKDPERLSYLRRLAAVRGLILLTDSDPQSPYRSNPPGADQTRLRPAPSRQGAAEGRPLQGGAAGG